MNFQERDTHGIYRTNLDAGAGPDVRHGPGPELMGANTLIGNAVCNQIGEKLGDVKEIMLNMRSGRVDYVVLSFGGFLGLGEKLFAVPWEALSLDTEVKCFVLNVTKERLETAPGFDAHKWPDMADPTWATGVHDFYGTKPQSLSQPQPQQPVCA